MRLRVLISSARGQQLKIYELVRQVTELLSPRARILASLSISFSHFQSAQRECNHRERAHPLSSNYC
jgi:hypothetical protein